MPVHFDSIKIGNCYDRPELATLWGYESFHAISKGVVTPKNSKYIVLFVTKIKQESLTDYNDFIQGDILFWEGEEKHSSDLRIINARKNGDEIHLFFREMHHTPFIYFGEIFLSSHNALTSKPSEFQFELHIQPARDLYSTAAIIEDVLQESGPAQTVGEAITKVRIGQAQFRRALIKVWDGKCAITGVSNLALLRASHIKPWNVSDNRERLDPFNGILLSPNIDAAFDDGFISFNPDGEILLSKRLYKSDQVGLGLNATMRLSQKMEKCEPYLEFHRRSVYVG